MAVTKELHYLLYLTICVGTFESSTTLHRTINNADQLFMKVIVAIVCGMLKAADEGISDVNCNCSCNCKYKNRGLCLYIQENYVHMNHDSGS